MTSSDGPSVRQIRAMEAALVERLEAAVVRPGAAVASDWIPSGGGHTTQRGVGGASAGSGYAA
ncbi:hypothetical protein ACP70R_033750 [Stipagrostis hirtigluma subsp. patula]